jgi:hypothetical protein
VSIRQQSSWKILGRRSLKKVRVTSMRETDNVAFGANTLHKEILRKQSPGKIPLQNYQLFRRNCQPGVIVRTALPAK